MSNAEAEIASEPPTSSECPPAPVPATPAATATAKPPAVKKFSSLNINKKFLGKQDSPSQPAQPKNASCLYNYITCIR